MATKTEELKAMERLSGVDKVSAPKALLVSPDLCIGCRGCQTACKQWNKLAGDKTHNSGSFENPPDLSATVYNRIRFIEVEKEGRVDWLFVSKRCMHCADAGCMRVCPSPGALYRTKQGAVAFNRKLCIGCKLCRTGCPFDVPRFDVQDKIAKCNFCEDRTSNGLEPLCSKTCPTGAIRYGDREALITGLGEKKPYGTADAGGLGVLFALKNPPEYYKMKGSPDVPLSVLFWDNVLKPLTALGIGVAVAGAAAHYLTVGPREDSEEGGEK